MAYDKYTWQTGEVITQEKLNHMEQGIEDGVNGYECTETVAEVFDDSVAITTSWNGSYMADLSLEEPLESAEIKVVFNGVEYTVERQEFYGMPYYGAPFRGAVSDYSTYPFCIFDDNADNVWSIAAQQSDTYNIIISAERESVEVTPCFEKAVEKVVGGGGSDGLKNLVDGSATGSVRGVGTTEEDSSYTMGQNAFAEGYFTESSGQASHAEGHSTKASNGYSHAEGYFTESSGQASHAEGYGTHATHRAQHVVGMYNEIDPSQAGSSMRGEYAEMVGNGSSDNNRSNARTLDWNGNEVLQGSLTLGKGSADETIVTATQLKALIALLNQ